MDFAQAHHLCQHIINNIEKVIIGKRVVVENTLIAVLAGGHLLLEDVPGVGKTRLAKALARSIGGDFSRIQFTPDLMPSDVTGISIYDQPTGTFRFRQGPVFANVVLADEINRANPRTQSALLETMEERQVTTDGSTYALPDPFLVIATQNPVEYEGVYALPESQLDRFILKLNIGYPSAIDEKSIVRDQLLIDPMADLEAVCRPQDLLELQALTARCHVDDSVYDYVLSIIQMTRNAAQLQLGASPRGTIALVRTAQATATLDGRDYVTPGDIKRLAPLTLAHRVIIAPQARLGDISTHDVLDAILRDVAVPV